MSLSRYAPSRPRGIAVRSLEVVVPALAYRLLATLAWLVLGAALLRFALDQPLAATPLESIRISADLAVRLGSSTFDDHEVASDDLAGTVTVVGPAGMPAGTDLDAYELTSDGDQLLSFDTTVQLPGGVFARPGDVVRFDGTTYTVEFDAAARGIPPGVNVDAVAIRTGGLLLSFDTTVDLGGVRAEDEDLVLFDGAAFSLFFDGSAAGLEPALDLDAAHAIECNDHLLLSFDGSGTVGGIPFDDEDVLEYDRASTWEMAYDGSARHAGWQGANLDALSATVDLGSGPPVVFGQTIRVDPNKVQVRWTSPVAFKAVRGSFASPGSIGSYAWNLSPSGSGTGFIDASVPPPGTGFWYLVKLRGCFQSSWQSTLGAEPVRDAALP